MHTPVLILCLSCVPATSPLVPPSSLELCGYVFAYISDARGELSQTMMLLD